MRVLITGATGFVGQALVRRLLEAGHELRAIARDPVRAAASLGPQVTLFEPTALEKSLEGVDGVVNLAGEPIAGTRWTPEKKRQIKASRIELTGRLARAIAAMERRPVLVSASAIGFYGDRGDEILTEVSAPGTDFLSEVCHEWETAAHQAETRVVCLRIGLVLGAGGGALAKLLPLFSLGLGGPIGDGAMWWSWIHLHDLVEIMRVSLEDARYSGPINAVAPHPVTNAELTRALGRALSRPAILRAPPFALKLAFGEGSRPILDSTRVLPRALERLGFAFRFPALEEALRDIVEERARR